VTVGFGFCVFVETGTAADVVEVIVIVVVVLVCDVIVCEGAAVQPVIINTAISQIVNSFFFMFLSLV
jgi:hypothetical protein